MTESPKDTKKRRIEEENITCISPEKTDDERLEFLRRKELFSNDNEKRDMEFKRLLDPNECPPALVTIYKSSKERLDRILSRNGDKVSSQIPKDVQSFDDFCKICPAWNNQSHSYVFYRDDSRVSNKPWAWIQRGQLSGLCYIHGADLEQHNLVSMTSEEEVGMIDISKMIRESFVAKQLEDHIFNNSGGNSLDMLEHILEPNSIIFASGIEQIPENIKKYGPALVSRFKVYEDFNDNKINFHHDSHSGMFLGHHAMNLIGFRIDENNKNTYFLLQNWWKEKQYVEVSSQYFKSCMGTSYFVETPQMKIPDTFSVSFGKYGENESFDMKETFTNEDDIVYP